MTLPPIIKRHGIRFALSLSVILLMLVHAGGAYQMSFVNTLENFSYDFRLRMLMPNTIDERIVIVDIDEKSLKEQGRWPWSRDKLATLMNQLFDQYHIDTLGFDVVFAEKDESSGIKNFEWMQENFLKGDANFASALAAARPKLDYDQIFADSLKNRKVVMGYYFTHDDSQNVGQLPAPSFKQGAFANKKIDFTEEIGFGSNLSLLQESALSAGHFNPDPDVDGITRKVSILIKYKDNYYEALSVAVARAFLQAPRMQPEFAETGVSDNYAGLESFSIGNRRIPVDERISLLVPYRGPQGMFRYVSATDVLNNKVPTGLLDNKIVLLGTTAAGLLDLRATPVQNIYAGVEVHANVISGILDSNIKSRPAYANGAEFLFLLFGGLLLAILLPEMNPLKATLLTLAVMLFMMFINFISWQYGDLVLPIASILTMISLIYLLNMSYGFFIESRGKRQLAGLFGQYVPPELVDEMSRNPEEFSLEGESRDMTVLFSDVRGFTNISEGLDPKQLTQLMNEFLTPMTHVIHHNRGTIDKYMGDAIMAFWGAPLHDDNHARHALMAGMAMLESLKDLQGEFAKKGWPPINIGVGLNTGMMTVGNMGSSFRMAYTVMGDAVNLGSRLESLTKNYGVQIIVSEYTRDVVPDFIYRELDMVRVKGKDKPVTIYEPLGTAEQVAKETMDELKLYREALKLYRKQQWDLAELQLINLQKMSPQQLLYSIYIERIAQFRKSPPDENWDGVYNFETK